MKSIIMDLLIIVLLVLATGIPVYILHKVRRVHLMLFELKNDIACLEDGAIMRAYHQIEHLIGLYQNLQMNAGLPATREWAASPDFLNVLAVHIFEKKPNVIVECGSGVSTIVQARSLQLNGKGHIFSLDHNADYAEKTRRHLARLGLSDFATVIHAPLQNHEIIGETWLWYCLDNLPICPIDILIIDGPPSTTQSLARYPAVPLLASRFTYQTTIIVDDAARTDERKILEKWKKNDFIVIETIPCEKGCAVLRRQAKAPLNKYTEQCVNPITTPAFGAVHEQSIQDEA